MTLGLLKHVRRTIQKDRNAIEEPPIPYNGQPPDWDFPASFIRESEDTPN